MDFDSSSESDSEDKIQAIASVVASAAAFLEILALSRKQKRINASVWVTPCLKERQTKGRFVTHFSDMRANLNKFKENFHMAPTEFDVFFELMGPLLKPKINTRSNDSISPKQKLAAVFEYLARGSLQCHIASIYRISKQHFGIILDEVCIAICAKLNIKDASQDDFVEAANDFNSIWNFPNCLGAIDGKHVALKRPKHAASLFYNYKDFYSIVLMAAANSKYKFTFLDIGAYGNEGDVGVFAASKFGNGI